MPPASQRTLLVDRSPRTASAPRRRIAPLVAALLGLAITAFGKGASATKPSVRLDDDFASSTDELDSTHDGLRLDFNASYGWWSGASSLSAPTSDAGASRYGRSPPGGASSVWRWNDAIDFHYAHGALIVPLFGGFLGQAGGETTGGAHLFGLYGGVLLPGLGVRGSLGGGWTLEASLRPAWSKYWLGSSGGSSVSGSELSAHGDVRACWGTMMSMCLIAAPAVYENGWFKGASFGFGYSM